MVPLSWSWRDPLLLAGHDEAGEHREHGAVHGHRHAASCRGGCRRRGSSCPRPSRWPRPPCRRRPPPAGGRSRSRGGWRGRRPPTGRVWPGGQVAPVEGVGLLGRREPGVLADGPGPVGVHRGPHAADERARTRAGRRGGRALEVVARCRAGWTAMPSGVCPDRGRRGRRPSAPCSASARQSSGVGSSSPVTASDGLRTRQRLGTLARVATRFVIIGGGPAGNTAATHAARLGAEVTLIEKDVVGGAAHLWDCIPSKAMIATGGAMSFVRRIAGMGLTRGRRQVDLEALRERASGRSRTSSRRRCTDLLDSQGVRILRGTGRLKGPHEVVVDTADGDRRARGRRRAAEHRQPAPHPRLGRARRRPGADHPPGLPAARSARAPRGDRLGGHRRGVRAHVQLARARR